MVRLQAVQTIALFASKATVSHLLDLVEILERSSVKDHLIWTKQCSTLNRILFVSWSK